MGRKVIDLTGKTFGRLIPIRVDHRVWKDGYMSHVMWLCLCRCGNWHVAPAGTISSGGTRSCGCLAKELTRARSTKHGHYVGYHGTPEYRSWIAMRSRCRNPRDADYPNYGAKGIRVCPQWEDFATFYRDMGARPPGMTIDRLDVTGNYEPGNCLWGTDSTQRNNKRNSKYATAGGLTLTIPQWSRVLKVNYDQLFAQHARHGDEVVQNLVAEFNASFDLKQAA